MTVNIQDSALSIPESLDSLKVTHMPVHRIHFEIADIKTWYAIMKEARTLFGKNWKGQPHVKRRLDRSKWMQKTERVWFDVPDERFGTWVAIKHAVRVIDAPGK